MIDGLEETFPNSAEGRTYEDLEEIGGDIYARPFSAEQESLNHLVKRSKTSLEYILEDAKKLGYTSVGILGHGDPLCALDWVLRHPDQQPVSYAEMRDSYYPQKAQALEYQFNPDLKLEGNGRIITTEAATKTIEGFRNAGLKEAE